MTYSEWFEKHASKHREIVDRLLDAGYTPSEIIDYFEFANMVEHEPDFCLLYKENRKCHDVENLNCYLCACPHFRFTDQPPMVDGIRTFSSCAIAAEAGKAFSHDNAVHHDCSDCTLPHQKKFIEGCFDTAWKQIMHRCNLDID